MARLPRPGSDDGTWGTVLNDYLSQAHDPDGSLKSNAVNTSNITNGTISEAKLDAAVQTKLNAIPSGGSTTNLSTTTAASSVTVLSDTGTDATVPAATTSNAGVLSAADKTKLNGIATGATVNDTDANLKNRANHTGTQLAATVSDFAETVRDTMGTALVAGTNVTITPNDGADTITIAATAGGGGVSSVNTRTGAVTLTKTDVGLANADNTSDANKPISTAAQTALNAKADTATTITGATSITGGGSLAANRTLSFVNDSATPGNSKYYGTDSGGAKGYYDLPSGGGAVSSVNTRTGAVTLTKSDVGLANVDNTADSAKSITTTQISDLSSIGSAVATAANAASLRSLADVSQAVTGGKAMWLHIYTDVNASRLAAARTDVCEFWLDVNGVGQPANLLAGSDVWWAVG